MTGVEAGTEPGRFGKADLARIGAFVREHRRARGLSLRAVADLADLSIGAVRALESGQANPGLGTVIAIVDVLGIDLDRMVTSARGPRSTAAVMRADDGASMCPALDKAVLRVAVTRLPAESLRRPGPPWRSSASTGFVIEGAAVAVVAGGARHRLRPGDAFHAQPDVVEALAGSGPQDARLLQIADMRRPDDRTTHRAGSAQPRGGEP